MEKNNHGASLASVPGTEGFTEQKNLHMDLDREKIAGLSKGQSHDLEDWGYIISSLSSLFFSTYYVNLEQDTFRTVTQLGHIGDVLGDEVNYTAALAVYANHFIHPEDREAFLSAMSIQNLQNSLRWWHEGNTGVS